MVSKRPGLEERARLAPSDLWANRAIGIVVLVIGAAVTYSLVFTQFDQRVIHHWNIGEQGERIPTAHITCPSPWSGIVAGAEPDVVGGEDLCVMPYRTLWVEGVLTALITLALGTWFLARIHLPGPLRDLPWSVRRLRYERLRSLDR